MAKERRGRPSKSALGQSPSPVIEQPKEEEAVLTPLEENQQYHLYEVEEKKVVNVTVSNEDVEKLKELHDLDIVKEVKEMTAEEAGVNVEDVIVKITEAPEQPIEEIPVEVPTQEVFPSEDDYVEETEEDEKPPRTMASLSKAELRWFQRTGKMPK